MDAAHAVRHALGASAFRGRETHEAAEGARTSAA